ncbi:fumarylacetoacetate hydrolase family protein [Microbacterium sp. GXF7504]
MRLATVHIAGRDRIVAPGADGSLIDVAALLGRTELSMEGVIRESPGILALIRERIREVGEQGTLDAGTATWAAPVPRPGKIVGVAINNSMGNRFAHRPPTEPAYFIKPSSALIGHEEAIVVPSEYGLTHPEPELAAVIGRRSKHLTPAEALDSVFGYTIINDITSPGLKDRDSMELVIPGAIDPDINWRERRGDDDHSMYLTYHARSKGTDTFAPLGPWLVTADEVPEPNALAVNCYLDDELVLVDTTANLTFSVAEVLVHLTSYMTLDVGDVVHFGTAFRPAQPDRFPTIRHLDLGRIGRTVSVEIEGIGRLDSAITRDLV